jgi:hypothetical protein
MLSFVSAAPDIRCKGLRIDAEEIELAYDLSNAAIPDWYWHSPA